MFIGEAPGADEDAQGEPFVGKAGQLLTRIIRTMASRATTFTIANVLKCRPDMPSGSFGNRAPTPVEMQTCRPYLIEQIEIIQPKVAGGARRGRRGRFARRARNDARFARTLAFVSRNAINDHVSPGVSVAKSGALGKNARCGKICCWVLERLERPHLGKAAQLFSVMPR